MPARSLRALTLLALALLGLSAAPARASLDLTITNSTTSPGGVGSFEVVLSSSGGTFDVSAFSFQLQVASNSGVLFTSVTTNTTTAPYIFGTLQTPPFSFNTFPNTDFIASDSSQTDPFFASVTPQSSFGLGRVTYSVAPGTAFGPVTVSIVGTTGANRTTEVLDIDGNPFPITTTNGTIAVAGAVPEPASALLVVAGLGSVAGYAARRKRRAAGV